MLNATDEMTYSASLNGVIVSTAPSPRHRHQHPSAHRDLIPTPRPAPSPSAPRPTPRPREPTIGPQTLASPPGRQPWRRGSTRPSTAPAVPADRGHLANSFDGDRGDHGPRRSSSRHDGHDAFAPMFHHRNPPCL